VNRSDILLALARPSSIKGDRGGEQPQVLWGAGKLPRGQNEGFVSGQAIISSLFINQRAPANLARAGGGAGEGGSLCFFQMGSSPLSPQEGWGGLGTDS